MNYKDYVNRVKIYFSNQIFYIPISEDIIPLDILNSVNGQKAIFMLSPLTYKGVSNKRLTGHDFIDVFKTCNYNKDFLYGGFSAIKDDFPIFFENEIFITPVLELFKKEGNFSRIMSIQEYIENIPHEKMDDPKIIQAFSNPNHHYLHLLLSTISPSVRDTLNYDDIDKSSLAFFPLKARQNKTVALETVKSSHADNIHFFSFDLQCDSEIQQHYGEYFIKHYGNKVKPCFSEMSQINSLEQTLSFIEKYSSSQQESIFDNYFFSFFIFLPKEVKSDLNFITQLNDYFGDDFTYQIWKFLPENLKMQPEIFDKALLKQDRNTNVLFEFIHHAYIDHSLVFKTDIVFDYLQKYHDDYHIDVFETQVLLNNPIFFKYYKEFLHEHKFSHHGIKEEHLDDILKYVCIKYAEQKMYDDISTSVVTHKAKGIKF